MRLLVDKHSHTRGVSSYSCSICLLIHDVALAIPFACITHGSLACRTKKNTTASCSRGGRQSQLSAHMESKFVQFVHVLCMRAGMRLCEGMRA